MFSADHFGELFLGKQAVSKLSGLKRVSFSYQGRNDFSSRRLQSLRISCAVSSLYCMLFGTMPMAFAL